MLCHGTLLTALVLSIGGDDVTSTLSKGARARWTTSDSQAALQALSMSGDGARIVTGGSDGGVRLWDCAAGKAIRSLKAHRGEVKAVAFAPNGRFTASGGADNVVRVWDAAAGGVVLVWPALGEAAPTPWSDAAAAACWRRLGEGAEPAFDAMAWFRAEPEAALRFFDSRLAPMFRITQRLAELAPLLNDDKFAVRQQAAKEIESFGNLAAPLLRQRLDDTLSLEAKRRIEQILTRFSNANDAEGSMFLRLWRMVEVMEAWATPNARRTLERMAKEFPDQRLRQEASAALKRIASR